MLIFLFLLLAFTDSYCDGFAQYFTVSTAVFSTGKVYNIQNPTYKIHNHDMKIYDKI